MSSVVIHIRNLWHATYKCRRRHYPHILVTASSIACGSSMYVCGSAHLYQVVVRSVQILVKLNDEGLEERGELPLGFAGVSRLRALQGRR